MSFKRSQRELSIDVAEHRSMLKNYRNTHYPRFSVISKTGMAFPGTGFCFYCDLTFCRDCELIRAQLYRPNYGYNICIPFNEALSCKDRVGVRYPV